MILSESRDHFYRYKSIIEAAWPAWLAGEDWTCPPFPGMALSTFIVGLRAAMLYLRHHNEPMHPSFNLEQWREERPKMRITEKDGRCFITSISKRQTLSWAARHKLEDTNPIATKQADSVHLTNLSDPEISLLATLAAARLLSAPIPFSAVPSVDLTAIQDRFDCLIIKQSDGSYTIE